MTRSQNPWLILGMALLLLAAWSASALVQVRVDRELAPYRESPEMLWIPSGKVIRALSLGHQSLLANIYWTRVVQYYGSRVRDRKTDFSLLGPLLDITVALDPQLTVAYYFGSIFLSERPPRGLGDPKRAITLLQRGIVANPDEWRLWHHLGFLYYWELQDYPRASAAYLEGAKNPKARDWMKVMAAAIAEKGGSRETSLFLWSRIYDSTEDPAIRKNAAGHIDGLRAQLVMEEIEKRAQQFRDRNGRWPASIAEMVSQGLLTGVPVDPAGFPYQLQTDGKVALHPSSTVQLDYDRAPSPPKPATP
ncbi:MAG: tetratricopeptide repeat protein [Acidobacteria bacterium]|nr:tetratricopeptide repeat protein [Acidobacteriota bacterium]